jgi:hypothetical protein
MLWAASSRGSPFSLPFILVPEIKVRFCLTLFFRKWSFSTGMRQKASDDVAAGEEVVRVFLTAMADKCNQDLFTPLDMLSDTHQELEAKASAPAVNPSAPPAKKFNMFALWDGDGEDDASNDSEDNVGSGQLLTRKSPKPAAITQSPYFKVILVLC